MRATNWGYQFSFIGKVADEGGTFYKLNFKLKIL